MLELSLNHYLTVSAMLFALGIFGIFLNRKNVITILMSIELMLLAVNLSSRPLFHMPVTYSTVHVSLSQRNKIRNDAGEVITQQPVGNR
nr:NADH-quinone oxidoreductase subunit K [Pseudomonas sp.]